MEFEAGKEAGWHVIIGDNGSGKTSVLRAIALGYFGKGYFGVPNFTSWIKEGTNCASIAIYSKTYKSDNECKKSIVEIKKTDPNINEDNTIFGLTLDNWQYIYTDFIAAYGSSRKSNKDQAEASIKEYGKQTFCLTLFTDNQTIRNVNQWLKNVALDDMGRSDKLQNKILQLINQTSLLPNGVTMQAVTDSRGISFKLSDETVVGFDDLSDGYQSVLLIALDMIRSMIENDKIDLNDKIVQVKGIVLIDEIDAHLHPTWQTRIGEWFTANFPNIQFIVTTHSPLVCRGCEKGTIWRLAAAESGYESGEITGIAKDRLVYGNILDAYGTEVFGKQILRSKSGIQKMNLLAILDEKSMQGIITPDEELIYEELLLTLKSR